MIMTISKQEMAKILNDQKLIPEGYTITQITRGSGEVPHLKIYLEKNEELQKKSNQMQKQ